VERDDRKLIEAFQAGEYSAFDILFKRYASRVLAFAYEMTNNASEAEDLTQEVFIGAFKGLHRFRVQATILTWLFSITLRRWRDKQRTSRPETVSYLSYDFAVRCSDFHSPQSTTLLLSEEMVDLQNAMARLTSPLREAIALVVVQERTYREAAEIIGCPVGTLKSRLAAALQQIRTQIREVDHVDCMLP
jgi:RNA polymerase sigma-70 factor (ECF subfamily)